MKNMIDKVLVIDVVDLTAPPLSTVNIAVINQPNPVTGYSITGPELLHLIQFSKYKITDSSTGKPVNGKNIYDYFPELDPSGGGSGSGVEVVQQADWESMSTAQKQSYDLLAIQTSNTGFERGLLVNGKDYVEKSWDFTVITTGSTNNTASYQFTEDGSYQLFMITINSEASDFALNNHASLNANPLVGDEMKYNKWDGSSEDRRNYRITKFEFDAQNGDTLTMNGSEMSGYSVIIYVIIKSDIISVVKTLSTPDAITNGYYDNKAIVMYGTSNANASGSIVIEDYSPNTVVTTPSPGTSYKSSFIFWFTI